MARIRIARARIKAEFEVDAMSGLFPIILISFVVVHVYTI